MKQESKTDSPDYEMMNSTERREDAYIISNEYKQLCRDKNWIIIKLFIIGWLGILLILTLLTSKLCFFVSF
jgi:hypothetical protein